MLNEKQIEEIREHLEKAQNPLFFFDNDNDGLTSFLLLRRFIDRGKGIPIRSYPELNESYYKRVKELNSDYVFILDKPVVSDEFLDKVHEDNLPLVWIDHHQVDKPKQEWVNYYNPYLNDKTNEPVSYISYKIANKKDDIWIAVIGCVSDALIPDFYKEFQEKYPELDKENPKSAFDVLYNSEIGKIAMMLDFSLKDSITNVVNMLKFMVEVKSPYDVLEENQKTKQIMRKYNEINAKYQSLLEKARKEATDKLIFFQYSGEYSISSNISNQLKYENPDKVIVVAYIKDDMANISLRGSIDIRKLTLDAIKDIDGATGGGHKQATGAKMSAGYLPGFKEKIEELLNDYKIPNN